MKPIVVCEVCKASAELPEDHMPLGWTVVYQDDYLDKFYCEAHS